MIRNKEEVLGNSTDNSDKGEAAEHPMVNFLASTRTKHVNIELDGGDTLVVFVNLDTRLLVVDVVNSDESFGNEFVRTKIPKPPTPAEAANMVAMNRSGHDG